MFQYDLQFCLNISRFKKNLARFCHKCTKDLRNVPSLLLAHRDETWIFFDRVSKKWPSIKFHENLSSGSGRTDRQTNMMKPTVAFLKFARARAQQQDHYWTHTAARPLLDTQSTAHLCNFKLMITENVTLNNNFRASCNSCKYSQNFRVTFVWRHCWRLSRAKTLIS